MSGDLISIAISALGGHGGGVLANWIAAVAEREGYHAQVTSVPGFAQRSGATIYYVEIAPGRSTGRAAPVFALMAVKGRTDIVIASELTEAGRAVLQGYVTPDRTLLIASSHREYTNAEKLTVRDTRSNPAVLRDRCAAASMRFVAFDMQRSASEAGSMISAVMLGALAASGRLPFARSCYETLIRQEGIAVDSNLRGFAKGYDRASINPASAMMAAPAPQPVLRMPRVEREFPAELHDLLNMCAQRLIEYQDGAYASRFLAHIGDIYRLDAGAGGAGRSYLLTCETARLLALRMAHEDMIRVADIKTRARRFEQVRTEHRLSNARSETADWRLTEYLAPRIEEICDILPSPVGRRLLASRTARAVAGRAFRGGRTIETSSIRGFCALFLIARLRFLRKWSLGQANERELIDRWLGAVRAATAVDYNFGVEVAGCLGLVRGYGSTIERGRHNFEAIMEQLGRIGAAPDPAPRTRHLREAAVADDDGTALRAALAREAA
ncbi:MAG: indolepyruvate oxidoreductase subunit beta family protein [Sphingopyxis sp.]